MASYQMSYPSTNPRSRLVTVTVTVIVIVTALGGRDPKVDEGSLSLVAFCMRAEGQANSRTGLGGWMDGWMDVANTIGCSSVW
jgi:hypothetical protein